MRAVHLRRAGDHVLDVVGVTRAVDVRVVTVRGRVLDVAGRDRQDLGGVAAALRLRGLGDLVVGHELRPALVSRDLGQRRGQGRLAVVDVADGANVDVRFGSIEFLFCHVASLPRVYVCPCPLPASYNLSVALRLCRNSPGPPPLAYISGELWQWASFACIPSAKDGADDQDRTGDLVLTKDALCQLSYIGLPSALAFFAPRRYGRVGVPAISGSCRSRGRGLPAVARARQARAKSGAGDGDRTRDQQLGRL